ncbi:MAG: hypothetical protein QOJ20_5479 [Mycobacterium sp.]|nr:hypothetical protein [Mycobacterium sp.]
MHTHWAHVGRGAAGLGAAMGIGRFAYTPILPLMTTQAALTPQAAGTLATVNYVGYLAGALAGTASPRLARSTVAWRVSLVAVVVTLAAMPLLPNIIGWVLLRTIAGFASAVVFVIAVNSMLDHLPPYLPGWGVGGGCGAEGRRLGDARTIPARRRCHTSGSGVPATREPVVRGALRQLHPRGNRVHHRGHVPRRGHQTEFVSMARQRRLALRRSGRGPVGRTVGLVERAMVASDSARGSPASAGIRDRSARRGSRGGRGSSGCNPLRRHLHRGQHDGPGSRTPARIPRRRRPDDYRLLRRADPGSRGGDTSSTPRLFTRSARRGAGRRVVGDGRRSASVRIPVGRCGSAAGSHASSSSTPNSGVSRVNSPITARTAGLSSP